jgi:uncharacterized protein (DUF1330 family)
MAAYVITSLSVNDPVAYEEYRKQVLATIDKYEGKFIVRGGKIEQLEGNWLPGRLVVIEFASTEQAKHWYNSPEYSAIKSIRINASTGDMLVVEGV